MISNTCHCLPVETWLGESWKCPPHCLHITMMDPYKFRKKRVLYIIIHILSYYTWIIEWASALVPPTPLCGGGRAGSVNKTTGEVKTIINDHIPSRVCGNRFSVKDGVVWHCDSSNSCQLWGLNPCSWHQWLESQCKERNACSVPFFKHTLPERQALSEQSPTLKTSPISQSHSVAWESPWPALATCRQQSVCPSR